jgi:hypothetical protein
MRKNTFSGRLAVNFSIDKRQGVQRPSWSKKQEAEHQQAQKQQAAKEKPKNE